MPFSGFVIFKFTFAHEVFTNSNGGLAVYVCFCHQTILLLWNGRNRFLSKSFTAGDHSQAQFRLIQERFHHMAPAGAAITDYFLGCYTAG